MHCTNYLGAVFRIKTILHVCGLRKAPLIPSAFSHIGLTLEIYGQHVRAPHAHVHRNLYDVTIHGFILAPPTLFGGATATRAHSRSLRVHTLTRWTTSKKGECFERRDKAKEGKKQSTRVALKVDETGEGEGKTAGSQSCRKPRAMSWWSCSTKPPLLFLSR